MLNKIIGAVAGSKLAKTTGSIGGTKGALLGMGAAALVKRASLPALVVLTAGGYLAKKYLAKNETKAETATEAAAKTTQSPLPPKVAPSAA